MRYHVYKSIYAHTYLCMYICISVVCFWNDTYIKNVEILIVSGRLNWGISILARVINMYSFILYILFTMYVY